MWEHKLQILYIPETRTVHNTRVSAIGQLGHIHSLILKNFNTFYINKLIKTFMAEILTIDNCFSVITRSRILGFMPIFS